MNQVVLTECRNYEADTVRHALMQAMDVIGGLDAVKPGMKVALKVNLVTGKVPEAAATTNPVVVSELCRLITERGATPIIGDSPGGLFTTGYLKGIYKKCGLSKLSPYLNEDVSIKEDVFQEGVSLRKFVYTGWIDQADLIINCCKLKTHGMLKMTNAVKNIFGLIPGTTKPEYHMRFPETEAFAQMLIDLNERFHPVLHVVDAVVCMEGNGPTAGVPREMGLLAAGKNPYALDLVCADLIGLTRSDVPTLEAAYKRGLGCASAKEIEVIGERERFRIPDFRTDSKEIGITFAGRGRLLAGLMEKTFSTRPVVKPSVCIGCRKCFEICPAGAISMEHGYPDFNRKKCIKCFCCQEFCPAGAIVAGRTMLGSFVHTVTTQKN